MKPPQSAETRGRGRRPGRADGGRNGGWEFRGGYVLFINLWCFSLYIYIDES